MKRGLDDLIEDAAFTMPPGWYLDIHVERGGIYVMVVRPDHTDILIGDNEGDPIETTRAAIAYIRAEAPTVPSVGEENETVGLCLRQRLSSRIEKARRLSVAHILVEAHGVTCEGMDTSNY